MDNKELIIKLNEIGAFKFGQFKLKSGIMSPIYITLRTLVSYPEVLKEVAKAYIKILDKLRYDRMAAVPYAALPIAATISCLNNKPWIYTRKEQKDYGIKKPAEGEYNSGEKVVVIDDLISTGLSKFEIIKPLEDLGLKVKDIVVLFDREQNGKEELRKKGYRLHAVLTMTDLLDTLLEAGKLDMNKYEEVMKFLGRKK